MKTTIKLEDLGYSEDFLTARVIAEYKGSYRVKDENGEYLARITRKQVKDAVSRKDYPAVGDWVVIDNSDNEEKTIYKILPRKTILRKRSSKQKDKIIATNVDVVFIVESVNKDYNLNRFERYLVLANDGGIKPVIILNKIDLISDVELKSKIDEIKERFKNIDIILTSAVDEKVDEIRKYIQIGKTYCFLGSSGVGKSSLINSLTKEKNIKTGEIDSHTDEGKHITTSREMYFLENGGILIDNPGIREVGVADFSEGIDNVFDEITTISKRCKYVNCTHTHEKGCAVLDAIKQKELDEDKYSNFIKLKKEVKHYESTELERREKNRKFGKFKKVFKKDNKMSRAI